MTSNRITLIVGVSNDKFEIPNLQGLNSRSIPSSS